MIFPTFSSFYSVQISDISESGLEDIIWQRRDTNFDSISHPTRDYLTEYWTGCTNVIMLCTYVMYQEYDKGSLRMIDVDLMFKSWRLAWIPRLLQNTKSNWKTVPEHFFRKCGSLRFLLRCNYHTKNLVGLPKCYRDALSNFSELKSLYNYNSCKENLLFNNQDILIDGKPIFLKE